MKVVFTEEVEGTAHVGEVKQVKNGFARNYLLPRGLAAPATKENLKRAEKLAQADTVRQAKLDGAARGIAAKIDGATVVLHARVGQQGRLFGSITAARIAEQLSEIAGEPIDHRQVLLAQALRALGEHPVRVRFTRNISVNVTVEVQEEVAEGELTITEAVAAVEAEEAAAAEQAAAAEEDTDSASGDDPPPEANSGPPPQAASQDE